MQREFQQSAGWHYAAPMNRVPPERHQARYDLDALITRFRRDPGYPQAEDLEQIAARAELVKLLSQSSLDAAVEAPRTFDTHGFMRLASDPGAYGYPGNQVQINVHLQGGNHAIAALAKTIRYLLYGPGNEVKRLDDVISKHSSGRSAGSARLSPSSALRSGIRSDGFRCSSTTASVTMESER